MTSKEAINNIRDYIVYRAITYNEALNNVCKVEQDLEILEILKPFLKKLIICLIFQQLTHILWAIFCQNRQIFAH